MRIEFVEAGSDVTFELHEVDGRTARANLIRSHHSPAPPAARSRTRLA